VLVEAMEAVLEGHPEKPIKLAEPAAATGACDGLTEGRFRRTCTRSAR
jgi:hypothetical protein